jgi:ABC-2 type transport system ATP-binding protein
MTTDVPNAEADVATLSSVGKSFGTTVALDDISFSVQKGEMFGVIGPDGAGKTTLLRMICGLLGPDRGTIRLFGEDPYRTHRAATSAIGYVSQRFSLYGDLSIDENIEFFARLHGVADFASIIRRHETEARARVHPGPRTTVAGA